MRIPMSIRKLVAKSYLYKLILFVLNFLDLARTNNNFGMRIV